MAERALKRITIVGGGTAGWLTAALLARFLQTPEGGPSLAIELIESPNIPTVGVGEATVPAMPRTLRQLGLSERDFFRRCNASFKLGVRFVNWDVDEDGNPSEFLNNFDTIPWVAGHSLASYFTRFATSRQSGRAGWDFVRSFSPAPDLIEARKGPRAEASPEFESPVGYAYHLDAGELAGLLSDRARALGVTHILDDVEHVALDERGFVSELRLKERGAWPVEFVIDCTGFRGLIINQALGEPFESYQKHLLNDRALAVQIPHDDVTRLEPCTRSTALGAGWVWRVPLRSRIGTGYVFSSRFRSDEEATREFLAHLGPGHENASPRAIPLRVGHSRRSWVNNCLAIGLSGGFIEPLESTAIYMIEMAVRWLIAYFPDRDCDPVLARRFNTLMNGFYDEVRDFICLHFHLNNRSDSPYWVAAREELAVPDSLAENLAVWRHNLPVPHDLPSKHLFNYDDYILVLIAKGYYRHRIPRPAEALPRGQWEKIATNAAEANRRYVAEMPSHFDLITAIRGEEEPAEILPVFASAGAGERGTVAVPGAQLAPEIRFTPAKDGGNLL